MPLYIFARFHAKLGAEEQLRQVILAVAGPSRAEAGCRDLHVFRSNRDQRLFFIHSTWATENDFELHAELPHTRVFLEEVVKLIDHDLDVNRTTLIA